MFVRAHVVTLEIPAIAPVKLNDKLVIVVDLISNILVMIHQP